MKRPTISDVAKHAGVSKSTVSHVLNGTRFVAEETRTRVMQAVEELGYRPSNIARSLSMNRTQTIGIIISDASNNYFGDVLRGAENVLRPAGYSLVVCNTNEILEREEYYLNLLLEQRVDGIIAAATSQRWAALSVAEVKQMPIVFVDRQFEGIEDQPYIGADNEDGTYRGTCHLIECGHRDIGIIAGFQRLSTMRERLAGFRRALQEYGIPLLDEWVVHSLLGVEPGRAAATQLMSLPKPPTALFSSNNFLSLGTLLALRDMGLRCPDDVSLVGFDDHPWAEVSDPPLTVIRQPSSEIGKRAAETMLALLQEKTVTDTRVMLDTELIVRQSCKAKARNT